MFFPKNEVEVFIDDKTSVTIREVSALEMTVARNFLANSDLRDDMITNETYACALCLQSVRTYDENKKLIKEDVYPEIKVVEDVLQRLDKLIALIENGADIRINEKKIGVWLGKYTSKVNSLEN
jgi:hypothetical protein